jgi:hypothetical protein
MLIPLLNKEDTSLEMANLHWLLIEIINTCEDSNIRWQAARLSRQAQDLYEAFSEEYFCKPEGEPDFYKNYSGRVSQGDKTEALLSLAFNAAAMLDAARYEGFKPDTEFSNGIKYIRKETLRLLHEKKGWSSD